jgi:hypothetical protein
MVIYRLRLDGTEQWHTQNHAYRTARTAERAVKAFLFATDQQAQRTFPWLAAPPMTTR